MSNIVTELKTELNELTADERRLLYLIEETDRCNERIIRNYKDVMIRKEVVENLISMLDNN